MKLTRTDLEAIKRENSDYINTKGADLYMDKDFENAIEYYRLASSMGNAVATCNLGYCYLYGRGIEQNPDLALAYFELALTKEDIEAAYKLGDIYGSDHWGVKDLELSIYYYRMAARFLSGDELENIDAAYEDDFSDYPSLSFALGREMMPEGGMKTDIKAAYHLLRHAKKGYERELQNGADFYEKAYRKVMELLEDDIFAGIQDEDMLYDEEY